MAGRRLRENASKVTNAKSLKDLLDILKAEGVENMDPYFDSWVNSPGNREMRRTRGEALAEYKKTESVVAGSEISEESKAGETLDTPESWANKYNKYRDFSAMIGLMHGAGKSGEDMTRALGIWAGDREDRKKAVSESGVLELLKKEDLSTADVNNFFNGEYSFEEESSAGTETSSSSEKKDGRKKRERKSKGKEDRKGFLSRFGRKKKETESEATSDDKISAESEAESTADGKEADAESTTKGGRKKKEKAKEDKKPGFFSRFGRKKKDESTAEAGDTKGKDTEEIFDFGAHEDDGKVDPPADLSDEMLDDIFGVKDEDELGIATPESESEDAEKSDAESEASAEADGSSSVVDTSGSGTTTKGPGASEATSKKGTTPETTTKGKPNVPVPPTAGTEKKTGAPSSTAGGSTKIDPSSSTSKKGTVSTPASEIISKKRAMNNDVMSFADTVLRKETTRSGKTQIRTSHVTERTSKDLTINDTYSEVTADSDYLQDFKGISAEQMALAINRATKRAGAKKSNFSVTLNNGDIVSVSASKKDTYEDILAKVNSTMSKAESVILSADGGNMSITSSKTGNTVNAAANNEAMNANGDPTSDQTYFLVDGIQQEEKFNVVGSTLLNLGKKHGLKLGLGIGAAAVGLTKGAAIGTALVGAVAGLSFATVGTFALGAGAIAAGAILANKFVKGIGKAISESKAEAKASHETVSRTAHRDAERVADMSDGRDAGL